MQSRSAARIEPANISGFVNVFSGGALTQDSTSFDYKGSAVKVLRAHTLSFGGEFERDRIDMDDFSYTPGDNTFSGVRTAAPTGATVGLIFKGDPGLQASVFQKNWKDFAPRVGFAYSAGSLGRTVFRGGYGIFYGFPEGLLYQRTDAMQPVDLYLTYPAPAPTWDNIYAGYPGGDPFPRAHVGPRDFKDYKFALPVSGGVLDPQSKVNYTQNWNLTSNSSCQAKSLFRWSMWVTVGRTSWAHANSTRQYLVPGQPSAMKTLADFIPAWERWSWPNLTNTLSTMPCRLV